LLELLAEIVSAQRHDLLAVDEDWGCWQFACSRQGDADVCIFRFTRAVDDTAHHGKLQFLEPTILVTPFRQPYLDIILDLLSKLLENGRGGPATTRACDDLWRKRPQPHRLQDLLADSDFE